MTELEKLEKELLQEIQEEPGIYANAEEFCTIDPETRTITVPLSKRILGTESDQETNRLYFKCPKVVGDNVDLSLFSLRINYQNAGNKKDQYLVEDVKEEGDTITFSWLLKRSVTAYKGNVKFILCAVKTAEDGAIKNEWNTTLNTECESLEGMEVDRAAVEEETKDIVEQLIAMMNQSAENAVHALETAKTEAIEAVQTEGEKQVQAVQGAATRAVETAKTEAIEAVQTEGTTQTGNVSAEGEKQVQAVQGAAQEIMADREQIQENKTGIAKLKEETAELKEDIDNLNVYRVNEFDKDDITIGKYPNPSLGQSINTFVVKENSFVCNQHWRVKKGDVLRWTVRYASFYIYDENGYLIEKLGGDGLKEGTIQSDNAHTLVYLNTSSHSVNYVDNFMFTINRELPTEYVEYGVIGIDTYNDKKTNEQIDKLKEEIADKATLENGVVKFWKASTEESRTDTLLYSVDISSIGGTGGLDLENLTLSVSQVGNYQRLSMSDGTTTKNVDIPITTITDEQVQNAVNNYMAANPIDETDPTVPDWAKQQTKPKYTASEVGAIPDTTKIPSKTSDLQNDSGFLTEHQDLSGYATKGEIPKTASDVGADASGTAENKVSAHNTATDAHNEIRLLVQGLTDRLNALADSDDETLDQMSEVVAYIKSNKSLIDAITTGKVSVSDIVDNLTTNVSNKPLSAAQGVILKTMIDEITIPEKLPNPYSLTFTGAVAGIYNGSEALTINIPSGGDGSTYYVTPEQYGATGDGMTDDTAAFQAAIDSKQPILCQPGGHYKLSGKLVAKNSVLYLDGNGSQFLGLQIDINSVDGTNWVDQYKSYEAVIKNCNITQSGNKAYGIFMAGPLRLENIDVVNYNEFLKMSANYLDNFSASGITHYMPDHTADYVTFNLMGGLGDKYLIERCHFVKVKAWGKQPITFLQCLNGGFFGKSSQANFISCHLENFKCELEMSEARFIGCYIWANVNLPKNAVCDKCAFIVHHMTNNVRNDFRALNTNDCKVYIHQNETTGYQTVLELDDYKKNTNIPIDREDQCIYFNSKGGQIKFEGQTGDYTYTVYPSVSPNDINGYGNANKFTHTVNIAHNGATPLFTANGYFKGMFYHVFRKNPDNRYVKAVIPYGYYIIDTGTSLNGILWERVTSIPDVKENKAKLINGIYVSDNPSNVNGENVLVINKSRNGSLW